MGKVVRTRFAPGQSESDSQQLFVVALSLRSVTVTAGPLSSVMSVRDIEAGAPASAPGKGTQVQVSDEDLSKALYGVHMGELFAERIHSGMETRAVLAGFVLAFALDFMGSMRSADWNSQILFRVAVMVLSISSACGFFAVVTYMMTSTKISRLFARKDYRFGQFDFTHDPVIQLRTLRKYGPKWETEGFEEYLSNRTSPTLNPSDRPPERPKSAHSWLVEDYRWNFNAPEELPNKDRSAKRLAVSPLFLTHMATLAFALSLILFTIALIIKQIDQIGWGGPDGHPILCIFITLIFVTAFGATFVVLHQNGTLHELDTYHELAT